jgi:hypothetical protein
VMVGIRPSYVHSSSVEAGTKLPYFALRNDQFIRTGI